MCMRSLRFTSRTCNYHLFLDGFPVYSDRLIDQLLILYQLSTSFLDLTVGHSALSSLRYFDRLSFSKFLSVGSFLCFSISPSRDLERSRRMDLILGMMQKIFHGLARPLVSLVAPTTRYLNQRYLGSQLSQSEQAIPNYCQKRCLANRAMHVF